MKYLFVIYPAIEGGYVAGVPELKGCLAQGDTLEDTLDELTTVADLWIEAAKSHGDKLLSVQKEINRVKERLAV